ncbi:hypothetical protein [Sphingomonas sp. PB4P5]|uniref:hypothetical protein n=1 Tax=Parasphingomonas puruogangriensis TaxID=3096155 RepID=UPI002FC7B8F9
MNGDPPTVPPIPVDPLVPPPPSNAAAPAADTVAQAVDRAEAAATRRRWVTLAELVGVAGVIIAAFGLWLTWSDRRADDQAKQAEQASERKTRTLVMLKATVEGDNLALSDPAHDVQTIDIVFPKALGVAAKTDADPQIDAGWVSAPMLKLTDGGADTQSGRLPVLITASYWDADVERHDAAIYDVVWKTEGGFPLGRSFKLEGLKLKERSASVARLEAIWARERPKPAK